MGIDSSAGRVEEQPMTLAQQADFLGGFIAGLRHAGIDLWLMLNGPQFWFAEEKTQRESPHLFREPLLMQTVLIASLADLLAIRDVWPPLGEYGDLPPDIDIEVQS